ncbi:MAG: HAD family phosphatase [Clostridia bacterium]|nr:HAD family phosphatase [Clostridia bacterium]
MIKNIIFDMGNVLIYFDPDTFIKREGLTGEDAKLIKREVFQSSAWAKTDRNHITEDEALQAMCRHLPEHLHDAARKMVMEWDKPALFPVPGMAELVKQLKDNGYGIYLLSNASCRQHEYWPRIPGSEYFEDTLISGDYQILKPQPEIYMAAMNRFHVKADECVFIDDSIANIEGADFCGLHGIVFHDDLEELKERLREEGVRI